MNKLKQHRLLRGMTQKDLAKVTNISQSMLTAMECGKKVGSIKTLQTLAKALGCKVEDIIEE